MLNVYLTITEPNGSIFAGDNAENVIRAMKLDGFMQEKKIDSYMKQVHLNICALYNEQFVYTDALSFLYGYCQATGALMTWEVI